MTEKLALKDHLLNRPNMTRLAGDIHRSWSGFKRNTFIDDVMSRFPELELKARIFWITECLRKHLPADYREAVQGLLGALPRPNDPSLSDDDFGDFNYTPFADFIATYGCRAVDFDFSLDALYEITQRYTAEDSIRAFLNGFPTETLARLQQWSHDSHYHVRRLVSEGTRPKLPWSKKINLAITDPIPLLDVLFSDRTRFVTRSVANHMNDISKIDPDLAIHTLTRWRDTQKQSLNEMNFIIRHALRSLIKQGHPGALRLIGIQPNVAVKMVNFQVPESVRLDESLAFSMELECTETATLLVDYIVHFQNKARKLASKKIFKLSVVQVAAGERCVITKGHLFRSQMSTRILYPGEHAIEVQANGKILGRKSFWLLDF